MAFGGNAMCTSFKKELLQAKHDFDSHTFKIALYDNTAQLTAATTDYTATGEISGAGYTAGGATLTVAAPTTDGTTALADFADVSWSGALTARGALIYNTTTDGGAGTTNAIAVLDFGSDRTSTTDFVVTFPTADGMNAIIRIA